MSWRDRAACKGMPVAIFYQAHGSPSRLVTDTCGRCPVRADCYAWALAHEEHGYWAGTGPSHRRAERKRRGIVVVDVSEELRQALTQSAAHGTPSAAREHQQRGETLCVPCRDAVRAYGNWRRTGTPWPSPSRPSEALLSEAKRIERRRRVVAIIEGSET